MIVKLKPKRDRTEQPTAIEREQSYTGATLIFGCRYADGVAESLFSITGSDFKTPEDMAAMIVEGFAKFDIDAAPILAAAKAREYAEEEAKRRRSEVWEAMKRAAMESQVFGSGSYFEAIYGYDACAYGRSHAPPPPRPANPERTAALAKCRKLKRLADGSTFPGERDNAKTMLASLMGRHSITEREL